MKYFLLLASMLLAVLGQFALKKGLEGSEMTFGAISILKTIFTPMVFFGFLMYGISSIVWLFVLQRFPLSVAYPSLAMTYVVVVVLSASILGEPLTIFKALAVALIMGGVILINR